MKWFQPRPKKEPERFYLLPGQGGESFRRKRRVLLTWSVMFALFLSGALAVAFYYMNRIHP